MNGERALIYSRIRVNQLDPSETDVTRGARQQAVMEAVLAKFTSPSRWSSLPFDGARSRSRSRPTCPRASSCSSAG
jgi:anionic cell wall polymer biosynthesis LytR-Cps2A-Psr (LCP) family protein